MKLNQRRFIRNSIGLLADRVNEGEYGMAADIAETLQAVLSGLEKERETLAFTDTIDSNPQMLEITRMARQEI